MHRLTTFFSLLMNCRKYFLSEGCPSLRITSVILTDSSCLSHYCCITNPSSSFYQKYKEEKRSVLSLVEVVGISDQSPVMLKVSKKQVFKRVNQFYQSVHSNGFFCWLGHLNMSFYCLISHEGQGGSILLQSIVQSIVECCSLLK